MNHILLLGAGFSRNWGGWTTEELIGDLLGRVAGAPDIQKRLQKVAFRNSATGNGNNFESVLNDLIIENRTQGTLDTKRALELYQEAIRDAFKEMNQAYGRRGKLDFCENEKEKELYRVNRLLGHFDAIFTLNQDLLLELFYRPNQMDVLRWNEIYFPMVTPPDKWATKDGMKLLDETWTTDAQVTPTSEFAQPVYKLHGSVNWRDSNDTEVLVIGTNKDAIIQNNSTLRHYGEEFSHRISTMPTRLMVIGYSFEDEHINSVIKQANKCGTLQLFIVDPKGYAVFQKSPSNHIVQDPELTKVPCIGISTRPLSSTFRDDVLERDKLFRFFIAPPVELINS